MVRVAGRSHGQTANLRVLESVTVVAAKCGRRIENLESVYRQCFQSGKTDSGAKQIVWVWGNGQTAAFMNHLADFARWLSLQVRQLRTDTEKMPISGRYLDSRQNEEIIDRQTIQSHQALLEQVIHSVACVVIGDSDAVQTFSASGRNHIFRAGNTICGKKRMRVQVDIKRHGGRRSALGCGSLHELFDKNACFDFGFLVNAIELMIV